ncbi:hypothetical protein [Bradyrhizobium sp. 192]|uniref:hypothetical protein n=1 Tax=Bradyrhizobium sp. 192 TaxID=2782660 RepID=UPI001FFE3B02|nr:hypothetical protein [Bradyrhizobium sp. 192]UPJ55421.1 hypothetical protein IVB24_22450 [Bradyrhizobium sp. 192]
MIFQDLRKAAVLSPVNAEDWFIGIGYLTIAVLAMAVWLYALARLATKILGWL